MLVAAQEVAPRVARPQRVSESPQSLAGDLITANQNAEQIAATETEPATTGSNDTRFPVPHHLDCHSLTKSHFFQSPHILGAPHQLVNQTRLTRTESIQRN